MRLSLVVLAVLASLVIAPPLHAQVWSREFLDTPLAKFSEEDLSLFQSALNRALESQPDGNTLRWNNPDSGVSGTVTPMKTDRTSDHECRLLRIVNQADGTSGDSQSWFCKTADGTWKSTSPGGEGG